MSAAYRVGFIACGLIAEGAHLPAYRKIPAVEVVAGADISEEVRRRWTDDLGVPHMYASAEELLEREKPDIVSICTWPPLRPDMVELACAAGVKGILAEKPMAVDLAGCDRMIAAAERAGAVLVIGHQRRFHNRYVKARELIDSGAIGDLVQITGYGGGDLLTGGTHTVDCIRYLVHDAPAEWVIGQIDRRDPGFTNRRLGLQQWEETHLRYGHHIEAGAFAMIQFQGGVRATIESGIMMRPGRGGWPATIYGTDGIIEVGHDRTEPGQPWLRARVKGEADWLSPEVEANDAFQAEIEALIDVIERGGTHPLDGRSARAGHEILMAIYQSARRRARIDLPLDVTESPLEAMIAAGEV
ncbi:MAG: Gfo/Idh/MocA family oxidoreductase [Chloroflexi bacterium]|nr:Gfo/Idh/MocA family oxidoreductase [Chloroflexota bacterium]